jgi:hypothetical protein
MPEPDKTVLIGAKAEPNNCPQCGEPLDAEHRGQHHHET